MRFYEHESKQFLTRLGIPVPRNGFATNVAEAERIATELAGPVVLKSQVLSGGRMKAGGVRFAASPAEAREATKAILQIEIGGQLPVGVLVESQAKVAKEYYAGILYDPSAKRPMILFSDMGGIDIEQAAEEHPDHVARVPFSSLMPFSEHIAKEAIASLGVSGRALTSLTPILTRLARGFLQHGLTLAEINPLAQLEDGSFVGLDCHVDMEEEARGGQAALLQELGIGRDETRQARPPTRFEIQGTEVDAMDQRGVAGRIVEFEGNLGLIIGAGGGSLTLFDAVRKYGGRAANYCEIGGNPSVRKAYELTKLILSKPGVEKIAVMMNVVSNTRVDIMARGVVKGVVDSGFDPAEKIAIFRIPGSWEEDGFQILRKYGVEYCDRSVSMDEAARRAVAKLASQ
ncbi:MAG: acetate--CoA ligase family protein [Chloroflexi bacterium]|nr:acetate--CoA ligase family protein [Chloroflexota bacterium]